MQHFSLIKTIRHAEFILASQSGSSVRFFTRFGMTKRAFTLAEVLITLGIIGVLAALTIPNLMKNYEKQQYVTQLKEVYSQLSQAMSQLKADESVSKISDSDILMYDGIEDYQDSIKNAQQNFLEKYFKVIKVCDSTQPSPCFAPEYKFFSHDGNVDGANPMNYTYGVITASGASLAILPMSIGTAGYIVVDVNGDKNPNVQGRDLFLINYYYDGSIDSVTPECRQGVPQKRGTLCNGYADAAENREQRFLASDITYGVAFGKILNDNWKMDY